MSVAAMLMVAGCSKEHTPDNERGYDLRILTFEDADAKFSPFILDYAEHTVSTWSDLVDDAQYDGKLLYGDYTEHTYRWYDEDNTELKHSFLTPFWAGGGHALSNYVIADYSKLPEGEENWYELQLATPNGGHNGSRNFAIHNGYLDSFNEGIYNSQLATLEFADGIARVIDHMWVMNTSYLLNSLTVGNDFCPKATAETSFYIVAEGYNGGEERVGVATFALCDKGVLITEWSKFNLSTLGAVQKVTFNIEASDDLKGEYGLSCPAYFAYDDVAVRFDK